uniref:Pyroglutamyl-peptidase I like n=1 Tax=Anolis carolinensis TaxID=28377 RepID=H9GDF4_ANOCA
MLGLRYIRNGDTLSPLSPISLAPVNLASASKRTIILEQCGKNKGYKDMDVCGFCPEDNCCLLGGPEKIESIINVKEIWKNLWVEGMDIIFSRDAGRYLCDYVYYTSLYYGILPFIHVPPLTKLVTAELLGNVLQAIILEMLRQCKSENTKGKKTTTMRGEKKMVGLKLHKRGKGKKHYKHIFSFYLQSHLAVIFHFFVLFQTIPPPPT